MTLVASKPAEGVVATGGWAFHECDFSAQKVFSTWYSRLSEYLGTGSKTVDFRRYIEHMPATGAGSQVIILGSYDEVAHWPAQPSTSASVNLIRRTFRLSVTDLAAVLAVERPTVYSWLKDASTPSAANEKRLQAISTLANSWSRSAAPDLAPSLKGQTSFGGTLLDALKRLDLPQEKIKEHLSMEALVAKRNPARDFAALARKAGIAPRPDADFDIATRRPLGPDA
ncbi:hypothetical protein E3O06_11615 [Cryobacterium glaciale]|uniref:XRE family transcriptional regulator n=1 Tax=Cryobacterium glaciale TaxID=1259145 RepID=A0A4R8UWM4_9MICO|nr:hypothetical protein [Cryobacterium glaciale]TFB71900.1 hypothetical protein E3O06_11615 [Cryobacterium glaciale]